MPVWIANFKRHDADLGSFDSKCTLFTRNVHISPRRSGCTAATNLKHFLPFPMVVNHLNQSVKQPCASYYKPNSHRSRCKWPEYKWPSKNKKEAPRRRAERRKRTAEGRAGGGRWRSLIQVGNPATPSNETDRLSYLHRLASINSRGWYTHTKASTRVYPPLDVQGGRGYQRATDPPTTHISAS